MKIAITDSQNGVNVGYIQLTIYKDQAELAGRFGDFLGRIPFKWRYPVGVFEDLFVHKDKRRRGYGRLGCHMADAALKKVGAHTGILKVGWSDDKNWEKAKSWKTRFFEDAGWMSLQWTFPEPVLMAKNYELRP